MLEERAREPLRSDYSAQAEDYERARPEYPSDIIDRLIRHVRVGAESAVTEIGAGTGLLTRRLAERGLSVTALEPNAAMRSMALELPSVAWRAGTFEKTGLATGSQDWVVCAQSFHWARAGQALPEIRRVLRANGAFTAMWYTYPVAGDPVLARSIEALRAKIPEYRFLDRGTWVRRIGSRSLSALPGPIQLAVGGLSRATFGAHRASRASFIQSTGDFGHATYHEQGIRLRVSRERYLGLWRSRHRLAAMAGARRFAQFIDWLEGILDSENVDEMELPIVFAAWSARAH